ncbi:MAG: hypothetical protein RL701_4650 [Pseudomonadota bacterium]
MRVLRSVARSVVWCLRMACFVVCLLLPASSRAQHPSVADPQAAARAAYAAGIAAYARGDNEHARQHFEAAEARYPSPNIELMLGRALARLEAYQQAHRLWTRALRGAGNLAKYASTASAARAELETLERNLAILRVRTEDLRGDESLHVNGQPVAQADWTEPLVVEPGDVRIEWSRTGEPPQLQQLELARGSAVSVTLNPPALTATAEKPALKIVQRAAPHRAPKPPLTAATTTAAVAGAADPLHGVGLALTSVGVAGLAAFGIFGALSHGQYARLDRACPNPESCPTTYRDYATRGKTNQTVANIALAAGAAVLATGVTLWVVSLPEERATLALTPGSVQLRGTF